MKAFKIEVNDNIADKILWLLNSFKNDVKVEPIITSDSDKIEKITASVKTALDEVKDAKSKNQKLKSAWDLVDEL